MFRDVFKNYKSDFFEDCKNYKNLPNIYFDIKGETPQKDFTLILEPEDYMMKFK